MTGGVFDLFDSFVAFAVGRILRDLDSVFSADDFAGADSEGAVFDGDFVGDERCCSFSRLASSRNFFFASFHGDESIPLDRNYEKESTNVRNQIDAA